LLPLGALLQYRPRRESYATSVETMTKSKTYSGSCHCGKVRFEVTAAVTGASACNCSICGRRGWLMTSVEPEAFKLLSGEGAQTDYQFGRKTMHHLFCSTCGVSSYGSYAVDGKEKVIVNLRCLDGIDVDVLEVQKYDGKNY
jgi:hypothetical protein